MGCKNTPDARLTKRNDNDDNDPISRPRHVAGALALLLCRIYEQSCLLNYFFTLVMACLNGEPTPMTWNK